MPWGDDVCLQLTRKLSDKDMERGLRVVTLETGEEVVHQVRPDVSLPLAIGSHSLPLALEMLGIIEKWV